MFADVDCWYVRWKVRLCHLSLSGANQRTFSSCSMFLQYTTCSLTINNNAITINNNAVTINNNVTGSWILLLWSCDFVKPKKSLEFSTRLVQKVFFITAVNNVRFSRLHRSGRWSIVVLVFMSCGEEFGVCYLSHRSLCAPPVQELGSVFSTAVYKIQAVLSPYY